MLSDEEQIVEREMNESDVQEFNLLSQGIAKTLVTNYMSLFCMYYLCYLYNRYITTRGIEIGKTNVLIHGQTLRGTKYEPRQDGSGVDLMKVVC